MTKYEFKYVNKNSVTLKYKPLAATLVNAAAIALNHSWREVYDTLIEAVHETHTMAESGTSLNRMMHKLGFVHIPRSAIGSSIDSVISFIEETFPDHPNAVIRFSDTHPGSCSAMVYEDGQYTFKGLRMQGTHPEGVWIPYKEGYPLRYAPKHLSVPRPYSGQRSVAASTDCLFGYQANPDRRPIGDCVIRAVSSVMNITWDQAIDALAEACDYTNTTLNSPDVFTKLLYSRGFRPMKPQRQNFKNVDGRTFCDIMNLTCHANERIFAYSGRNHVVAVLPLTDEEGTSYKIVDSWDSTSRPVGKYWVYTPPFDEKMPMMNVVSHPLIDQKLIHPDYGAGIIRNIYTSPQELVAKVEFTNSEYPIKFMPVHHVRACMNA